MGSDLGSCIIELALNQIPPGLSLILPKNYLYTCTVDISPDLRKYGNLHAYTKTVPNLH